MAKVSNDRAFQQDISHLEKIFELMDKHQIAELEWEKAGEKLKLKSRQGILSLAQRPVDSSGNKAEKTLLAAASALQHSPLHAPGNASGLTLQSSQPAANATSLPSNTKQALSPFVGTFYRSAAPGATAYVKEGQVIKRGDVLCIIEAMKLMNEIEAEFPGKIISVLVENGQPVEFGEPLFLIEPH